MTLHCDLHFSYFGITILKDVEKPIKKLWEVGNKIQVWYRIYHHELKQRIKSPYYPSTHVIKDTTNENKLCVKKFPTSLKNSNQFQKIQTGLKNFKPNIKFEPQNLYNYVTGQI